MCTKTLLLALASMAMAIDVSDSLKQALVKIGQTDFASKATLDKADLRKISQSCFSAINDSEPTRAPMEIRAHISDCAAFFNGISDDLNLAEDPAKNVATVQGTLLNYIWDRCNGADKHDPRREKWLVCAQVVTDLRTEDGCKAANHLQTLQKIADKGLLTTSVETDGRDSQIVLLQQIERSCRIRGYRMRYPQLQAADENKWWMNYDLALEHFRGCWSKVNQFAGYEDEDPDENDQSAELTADAMKCRASIQICHAETKKHDRQWSPQVQLLAERELAALEVASKAAEQGEAWQQKVFLRAVRDHRMDHRNSCRCAVRGTERLSEEQARATVRNWCIQRCASWKGQEWQERQRTRQTTRPPTSK